VLFDFFMWESECLQAQQKMEAGAMKSDQCRRFFMLHAVASFFPFDSHCKFRFILANLQVYGQNPGFKNKGFDGFS